MRLTVLLTFCLLISEAAVLAADYSQELFTILQLVQNKKYSEAIAGYEKFLQQAPKSLQGPVQFEIASLHALLGDKEGALTAMAQAIQSGFDDCLAVQQYEEWKPFRTDPRFNELKSRMRISGADSKEILWLKAEFENVSHDTKMMIIENTNRVDGDMTSVPQSTIPVRETSSPGVLFNRELVKMQHQAQRSYVLQADQARIRHVTNMAIISGPPSYDRVAISSRIADSAAEQRRLAIQARRFTVPAGVGTTPQPCP